MDQSARDTYGRDAGEGSHGNHSKEAFAEITRGWVFAGRPIGADGAWRTPRHGTETARQRPFARSGYMGGVRAPRPSTATKMPPRFPMGGM